MNTIKAPLVIKFEVQDAGDWSVGIPASCQRVTVTLEDVESDDEEIKEIAVAELKSALAAIFCNDRVFTEEELKQEEDRYVEQAERLTEGE